VADPLPCLVERELPVEPDDVAAARSRFLEVRGRPSEKLDHRHTCPRDRREELAVVPRDEAEEVLAAERPADPRVEHLQRLGTGASLRKEVVGLHGDELRQKAAPRGRLREHEGLRP
jgi:hypothetical protein